MKKLFLFLVLLGSLSSLRAQEYFPTNSEIKATSHNYTAFTHAKIFVTATTVLNNATLLIKDGKVVNAGANISIPKNSIVVNLKGKSIYPSFIDLYSDFGIKKVKKSGGNFFSALQYDSKKNGYYWDEHIVTENDAIDHFKYDSKSAKKLLNAGFGVVLSNRKDAIARGNSVLVALNSFDNNHVRVISKKATQDFGFTRNRSSKQFYPTSLMGMMALLRQMFYDASWYKTHKDMNDLSLDALIANENLPRIFDAGKKLNDLRAAKIAKEFGYNFILKGGGDEYEMIDAIKNTNSKYIIPLNFPDAIDVSNPLAASKVSLKAMLKWNQAPINPGVMAKNNIPFALTFSGLKKASSFKSNLLKAIKNGLDKTTALEALTSQPAAFIGKQNEIGSLNKGAWANFLITSGDVFDKNTVLYENWTQGRKNVVNNKDIIPINGDYTLNIGNVSYKMILSGDKVSSPKMSLKQDSTKIAAKFSYKNGWISINFKPKGKKGFNRISAMVNANGIQNGLATLYDGTETSARFIKKNTETLDKKSKKIIKNSILKVLPVSYPNEAFGYATRPKQQTILIKNATVWTNEKAGILKNTDVLLKDGKIAKIGKNLKSRKALVIDGTGKHLTTGIIDEHSHIAGEGINEAGHNSSAEVRIQDVINSDDISIYRTLAGGVTMSQILHGSANPIGGQSAIIKLKWSGLPKDIILKNQPKFIKFALGENVKQSNWGDNATIRYPQTRMGVEQVYMDYFTRAKEYDAKKKKGIPVRYDIELETLAEIINGERFITCHSYVQSEINMLMKVAEKFDFKINTFTHILEGYKVADIMKKHGVLGASTFSDWWAYKYEVNDAIPYNASIMNSVGLNVAINSDDAEMSRRLNQEAAKSVKYGNMSEEDAWKMVTLNPAKMLHLDNKMGSIKVGKDADVVIWSDNPLSIYAHAEKTIIEGTIYFDYDKDKQMVKNDQERRNTLINMMLSEKNKGMKTRPPFKKKKMYYTCESIDIYNALND
ncbi:MAG: amidohydrolase family protein [Flavobacteriaceae bacterium]